MMTTKLAGYIKQERLKKRLNYADLSRLMGYKNINRGMRRIIDLEREGKAHPEILKKITEALGLVEDIVDELIQQDKEEQQREFEEWVNASPMRWHLIIRWIPAVYGERDIPDNIKTEDEAIEYAVGVAKELKSMIWLVLSRKVNIHIDENGDIKSRNEATLDNGWLPATVVR